MSKKHSARLVTMDDAPQLLVLAREHHAESRYHRMPFSGRRVWALVRACVDAPNYYAVVLETDNALSGYCAMVVEPYIFAEKKIARELCLYIHPFARSMPAFQTLVFEVEKQAIERDVFTVDIGLSSPREVKDVWRYGKVYEHTGYTLHSISYSKEIGA